MGGDPASGAPSATGAQILQAMYLGLQVRLRLHVGNCTKVTVNGADRFTGYSVTAVPETVGKTGDRGFCTDQFGVIKYDPAGGSNCTQSLQ